MFPKMEDLIRSRRRDLNSDLLALSETFPKPLDFQPWRNARLRLDNEGFLFLFFF